MKNKFLFKHLIAILCDLFIAERVLNSVLSFFVGDGEANMADSGVECFKYFTIDSNIFCAVTCIIMIVFHIISLKKGENYYPKWAVVTRFVGTMAVMVTLLTVCFFLSFFFGFGAMFEGSSLYLHGICPILALLSTLFLDNFHNITVKQSLFGTLPVVIYGAVYLVNVIFIKVWEDFYHFNIGGFWPVTLVVMVGLTAVLSMLQSLLCNKLAIRNE